MTADSRRRDDDPGRPTRDELLRLLAVNAYAVYWASLTGTTRPKWTDLTEPNPGDLVLETSTIYSGWAPGTTQRPGLGILLRRTRERVFPESTDAEEAEVMEPVTYLRPIDGSVPEFRWTNANFIRVLTELPTSFHNDRS